MKTKILLLMLAVVLIGVSVTSAADFYMELENDGRIYVFDSSQSYLDWSRTGDLGKSTTRVGGGPNGETLVFMGELSQGYYEARHLPSHGKKTVGEQPASMPAMNAQTAGHKWSWKGGKTTWESPHAELSLSNRGQFRYTFDDPDEGSANGSFRIRRMKTAMSGWFHQQRLTVKLQMNWASSNPLEDAILGYDLSGDKALQISIGQQKVPFGRQQLTSSGKQQFVDRSVASGEFADGRDIGVILHGQTADAKLVWAGGVFNGAGINVKSNDNNKYQFSAHVLLQPFGDVRLSESDFESKDRPLFAIGAGVDSNDKHGATDGTDNDATTFGIDGAFKYRGFSAVAEYFRRSNQLEPLDGESVGAEFDSDGFYLQAGMFVVPATFEIAVRYGSVDRDTDTSSDNDNEWGVALNHFWQKHNLKLQGDLRWLEDESHGETDRQARVQMQWVF